MNSSPDFAHIGDVRYHGRATLCGLTADPTDPGPFPSAAVWLGSALSKVITLGCKECVAQVAKAVRYNEYELRCAQDPDFREYSHRLRSLKQDGKIWLKRGFDFTPEERKRLDFEGPEYLIVTIRDDGLRSIQISNAEDFERAMDALRGDGG